MAGHAERRILLVGTTGVGKSTTGNTILGKKAFMKAASPSSSTTKCVAEQKYMKRKMIKVIDTAGFFGTDEVETKNGEGTKGDSPDDQQSEIAGSIVECSPGPHAVVIVLQVGRYTKHQMETVELIKTRFSEKILKYAIVLFTHGDDLEGQTIEQFVEKNDKLQELIETCGGRCHVIDNKHWKRWPFGDESNRTQVSRLLKTIEKLVKENGGKYYTNEFLQAVKTDLQNKDKNEVCSYITAAGCATGVLLGALLGIPVLVGAGVYHCGRNLRELLINLSGIDKEEKIEATKTLVTVGEVGVVGATAALKAGTTAALKAGTTAALKAGTTAALKAGTTAALKAGTTAALKAGATVGTVGALSVGVASAIAAGVVGGVMVAAGAVEGGCTGWKATMDAATAGEAAEMAKDAVIDGVKKIFDRDTPYKKID